MKVRQWAWLLLAGAVAPFVFDNGPDPVSDGLYRVVDDHGRIGYADAYGVVRIAPRFAFGLPFANGVARVTLSGHPAAVPGSEGEYHRWEDGDWFCINKSGSIVKCPSSYACCSEASASSVRSVTGTGCAIRRASLMRRF